MLLHSRNAKNLEWAITPIRYGLMKMSRTEMEKMRSLDGLVDIYIALCIVYGYPLTINRNMWHRCCNLLMRIVDNTLTQHYLLPILLERLVISSEENFTNFFDRVLNHSHVPMYSRRPFQAFFLALLNAKILKTLSWNPQAIENLKKKVIDLKCHTSVAEFLEQQWFPALREVYIQEKVNKKARMYINKEQLMMVCWHPDRVAGWLERGGWPLLDMMIGC